MLAFRVWGLLANGMGGLDWAGLPLAVALLGISDVEGLMHRLHVMKTHQRPKVSELPPGVYPD